MANVSTDQPMSAHPPSGFGHSSFEDPAFEPHSSYMFDEGGDDDFRNLQQSIGLHMSNFNAGTVPGTMDPMQSQLTDMLSLGSGLPSPDSSSWQAKPNASSSTAQSEIVDARRGLVMQNYGQITPPNDTEVKRPTKPRGLSLAGKSTTEASNAKSERARNAANQRHARKNQPRKESINSTDSQPDDESEGTSKREKYREKNRLAAAKCRAKKKTNTEDLESQARAIQGRNRQLKEEELNLRDELSFLRNYALEHVAGGCQNGRLLSYNQMKAEEAARIAQMGHSTHSPLMDMAPSPGSNGPGSRADSFSARRPSMQQLQSHTFGSGCSRNAAHGESEKMHQITSPMSDVDPSLFDFARPTTQQALASYYGTDESNDFSGFEQKRNGQTSGHD